MRGIAALRTLERRNLALLALSTVLVVAGYVYLRYAYRVTDDLPFAQEVVLVILGTIVTILITAVLLNRQTEVELAKEQSLEFVELKATTYLDLLGHLEEVLGRGTVRDDDILRLQFLTHRLALFASPEALVQYHALVDLLSTSLRDDRVLQPAESDEIQRELANLSAAIRRDLVGEYDERSGWTADEIRRQIVRNTEEAVRIGDGRAAPPT